MDSRPRPGIVFALCLPGLACGSPPSTPAADAAPPDAYQLVVAPPAEPVSPAPPQLTPCPTGWRETTVGEATACDPWPEGGPLDCGPAEAHFPGEPGCAAVGPSCGAGDYATDLPSDRPLLYVLAGAAAGGDGSFAAPFAAIADAAVSPATAR